METGERVAIKVLDKEKIQKQNMGAQIKKEISIMKMVKHPFVVGLKEVLASRTKVRVCVCACVRVSSACSCLCVRGCTLDGEWPSRRQAGL